jgi:hypothetical protein
MIKSNFIAKSYFPQKRISIPCSPLFFWRHKQKRKRFPPSDAQPTSLSHSHLPGGQFHGDKATSASGCESRYSNEIDPCQIFLTA